MSVLLCGCSIFPAPKEKIGIDNSRFYKRDMWICVDDICGEGMVVGHRAPSHKVVIESPNDLDLFSFSTCHREETSEEYRGGWFTSGKKYEGTYNPLTLIEDVFMCPVYVGAYDKEGQHAWGFIDFETPEAELPARVHCNGQTKLYNGVSVCQSKAGLIQTIEFSEETNIEVEGACAIPKPPTKLRWDFKIVRGECTYAFFGVKENKIHRLTTYGYDNILIRRK